MQLCTNSKDVKSGDIFICIPHQNAIAHCHEAIEKGAAKLVVSPEVAQALDLTMR